MTDQISAGVNNFTIVARAPLISAIDGSLNILDNVFVALQEEKDSSVRNYLEVYRFGIPAVIHVFQTCPRLINATYKVILGLNNILDLELSTASEWMVSAVSDVLIAIEILLDFDDSQLVSIEEEAFPFRATLEFVRDLRDTLEFLVNAGESYVNYYFTIDNILILLDQIDLNATGSSNDPRWNYISQNVSKAETQLNDLTSNISAAYNKTGFFKEKYYGPLTDTVQPFWYDLHTLSSGFRNNTEEMAQLFEVLSLTINATHHFSYGSENLISSLEISVDNDTFAGLQTTHNAESNLTMAASEANQAYTSLSILKYINNDAKKTWLDILKDGGSNQSLHGLTTQMITVIDKVKAEDYSLAEGLLMVVLMRSKMEELVNFWNILGFK